MFTMRRFISMLVLFSVFITSTVVFADMPTGTNIGGLNDLKVEVIFDISEESESYQLVKTKYSYIYYEDVSGKTSAAQINFDGSIYYYTDDGTKDTLYKYSIYADNNDINSLLTDDLHINGYINYKELGNLLANKAKYTESVEQISKSEISYGLKDNPDLYIPNSGTGYGHIAADVMESEFGDHYSGRFLKSKYSQGVTARLTESMSYFYKLHKIDSIRTGIDLGAILVGYFLKPKAALVLGIVDFIGGIYKTSREQILVIYDATIYYDQFAEVQSTIRARAGKIQYGNIVIGELSSDFGYGNYRQDYFFDDYDYLLDKAIYNHFNY